MRSVSSAWLSGCLVFMSAACGGQSGQAQAPLKPKTKHLFTIEPADKGATAEVESEVDRVEFLLEVCDPCQGADNAYTVNGVVADFYTPAYFEPLFTCGSKYSFCGALRSPRDVLPRCYLSWRSLTTGRWTKWVDDGQGPKAIDLGQLAHGPTGFRSNIDAKTGGNRHLSHAPGDHARVAAAREKLRSAVDASRARARAWRDLPIGAPNRRQAR